jgi:NADPH-dependent ferric siderophore reductase
VLVGDETALPAIGRRLEELPAGARASLILESDSTVAGYPLQAGSGVSFDIVRNAREAGPGSGLLAGLRNTAFPDDRSFVWVATESGAARAIRRYLIDERHVDRHWIKAAGYWQRGAAGSHDVVTDEP